MNDTNGTLSRFGIARRYIRAGLSGKQVVGELQQLFPMDEQHTLEKIVFAGTLLEKPGRKVANVHQSNDSGFVSFYARECGLDSDTALTELRGLNSTVRASLATDHRALQGMSGFVTPIRSGMQVKIGHRAARVVRAHLDGALELASGETVPGRSVTHIVLAKKICEAQYVPFMGYVVAQTVPPAPNTPVTPGKRRVFDQKLNAWIEVDQQATENKL